MLFVINIYIKACKESQVGNISFMLKFYTQNLYHIRFVIEMLGQILSNGGNSRLN